MTTRERTLVLRTWIGKRCILALLLVPAAVLMGAGNEGRVDKLYECSHTPRISISNLAGQIVIRGWDKDQVHAIYTPSSPRVEVDTELLPATGPAEKLHFTTHVLDPMVVGSSQIADYTLDVPVGASLEIRNPQGSVRVEGLHAEDASIEAVGGAVYVVDFSGHLSVRTVGGNIELVRPAGRIEANSITGNLHFVSPATSKLRGSTTSGRILYEGDFAPGGDYKLSDYSGEMDIICPATSSFDLNAKTVHGKLLNSMPFRRRRRAASPISSGNSLLGTYHAGDPTVELTSFSGTIRIGPQP